MQDLIRLASGFVISDVLNPIGFLQLQIMKIRENVRSKSTSLTLI